MKKILLIPLLFTVITGFTQPKKFKILSDNPARWTYIVERKDDRQFNALYEIRMSCHLNPGWRIYSQLNEDSARQLSLYSETDKKTAYIFGSVMEHNEVSKKMNDPHSGTELIYYEDRMDLVFNVRLARGKDSAVFKWCIDYQIGTGYMDSKQTDHFKVKLVNTEGYNNSGTKIDTPKQQ